MYVLFRLVKISLIFISMVVASSTASVESVLGQQNSDIYTNHLPLIVGGYEEYSPDLANDVQAEGFARAAAVTSGPTIDVWNGTVLNVGQNGNPQRWVNILGNVVDSDGISTLTYALNDGADRLLSIGPDRRRLANSGDFNIDIDVADLVNGSNTVEIKATDSRNNFSSRIVTVNYTAGQTWSLPYTVDWDLVSDVSEVAQIVDGSWAIDTDGLRPTQIDYTRAVAIGDMAWTDYEVSVPIIIHNVDMAGSGGFSGTPGLGILMRWQGHTDDPYSGYQPKTGMNPHGEIGWWRWKSDGTADLKFNSGRPKMLFTPSVGTKYIFKMRVETQPDLDSRYSLKVWEESQSEPSNWMLVRDNRGSNDLRTGSLMLLAHHVDASFGNISVTPLLTEFSLTANTSGSGSVSISPNQPVYFNGDNVTLTASPNSGWLFDKWTGSVTSSSNPLNLVMTGNQSVTANFIENITYSISVSTSGNGSVTKSPSQFSYLQGSTVTLTASPNNGWAFSGWSGDLSGTQNPLDITADSNKNIVANFVEITSHTLTLNTTGNGSINVTPNKAVYAFGEWVTLTAVPGSGFMFDEWSGDASGSSNPLNLFIDGDKTISANFDINGPRISVWNGLSQNFGQIGTPQQWVNILGNVSSPHGINSLTYRLNGGSTRTLSIGRNNRRLEKPGDFNVDLDIDDLNNGSNQLVITAMDGQGTQLSETVTINFSASNVWPQPYTINWNSVSNIPSVVQITDGQWAIGADGLRTAQVGYDRAVAIGDMSWKDYEVIVPIVLHSVDFAGAGGVSGTPGLGILMRWHGHTDDPNPGNQPKEGWLPHGEIGWWRWNRDQSTARLKFNTGFPRIDFTPVVGVKYIFRMRVETQPDQDSRYSLKVWVDGQPEPSNWMLVRDNGGTNDLSTGSFLLLAHHVDASFGDVIVTPLTTQ